jgi:hypothetical protein
MQHGVPAHSGRHACWSTWRETKAWIGMEDATYDHAYPVDADEQWPPGPSTTGMQQPPHPDRTHDGQQTRHDEVRDLYPPEIPKTQQANRMVSDVEATAGEYLDDG